MKVKSTRAFITKKYTFTDENDKDFGVEFKFYALSAKQSEEIQNNEDKAKVFKEIMQSNLKGDEPYKTMLLDYLYEEGNIYDEFTSLSEELGKLKKRD